MAAVSGSLVLLTWAALLVNQLLIIARHSSVCPPLCLLGGACLDRGFSWSKGTPGPVLFLCVCHGGGPCLSSHGVPIAPCICSILVTVLIPPSWPEFPLPTHRTDFVQGQSQGSAQPCRTVASFRATLALSLLAPYCLLSALVMPLSLLPQSLCMCGCLC